MNPAIDPKMEEKIDRILSQLDDDQLMALLHGRTGMTFGGIPEKGIPEVRCADGPQGIRNETGIFNTALPCGMALAATWDPREAEEFGALIAREAKALNVQVSLGPGLNLMRSPLCGRNFEYYGEDPVLSGKIGAGYVRGCQALGVAATPKHLAMNNQEQCRMTASSNASRKTLRELYLETFEIVIRESHPWAMMSSYNRINGVYASQCAETQQKFAKDECGFDGVMMSDWGGTHAAMEALRGGLDLEMGGNADNWMRLPLWDQLRCCSISRQEMEDHARRVLRLIFRTMEAKPQVEAAGECATARHAAIARRIGGESCVLLKNQRGILPIDPKQYRRILVCGPSADFRHCIGGLIYCGGSGAVHPRYEVTALEAIREKWGEECQICYAPGELFAGASVLPDDAVKTCRCDFFDSMETLVSGAAPFFTEEPKSLTLRWGVAQAAGFDAGPEALQKRAFAVRLQAAIRLPDGAPCNCGLHLVGLYEITFKVNGKTVFTSGDRTHGAVTFRAEPGADGLCTVELTAFRRMVNNVAGACEVRVLKEQDRAQLRQEALAAAKAADLVIYVGGNDHSYDKEGIGYGTTGKDIPTFAPVGTQNELIAALSEVNPNVVVALINGSAMDVEPWIDRVPAALEFWYPGQETGRVIADVLSGAVEPGGRLPFTWGRRLEDYACHGNGTFYFDIDGRPPQVEYKEGIFIGYRHFDREGIAPRFPFGFGLSYTTFERAAEAPSVSGSVGDGSVSVTLKGTVKNTGSREGSEVVQLYVAHPGCKREVRPVKVLRNFTKLTLPSGKSGTFTLALGWRDFAFFDEAEERFVTESGQYTLLLGHSAGEIWAEFSVTLR